MLSSKNEAVAELPRLDTLRDSQVQVRLFNLGSESGKFSTTGLAGCMWFGNGLRPRLRVGPVRLLVVLLLAGEWSTPSAQLAGSPSQPIPAAGRQFRPVSELPVRPEFPDPLVMLDGRPITTREQWTNERRPELIALFQHYMYGDLPPPPGKSQATLAREDPRALGGKATLKEVTITFAQPQLPPIHLMLVVPNGREKPAPVILSLNYFGNHTLVGDPAVRLSTNWMPERGEGVVNNRATEASRGTWVTRWDIGRVIERGYAVATFYNGDIDPDRPDERGAQTYFRKAGEKPGPHECGTIAAWAWGLSRGVDYLVTDADFDPRRIVVTGHSRLGKAALLAAALDERIALAIPHQAGTGGSGPSRHRIPRAETVKQINDQFPHWFCATFKEFNAQPGRLPFDQHCLVALCAPRPVLFTNGRADTWINPQGQFEVLRAAAPVFRLLGAGDFAATQLPPDGEMIDGALGYFIRPGGHSLTLPDWTAFLDFADKHLGAPAKPGATGEGQRSTGGSNDATAREAQPRDVPRWDMHEFEWRGRSPGANPFRAAAVAGEFLSPSGKTKTVDGFYEGDNTWRLRFSPDEEGQWSYVLRGEGAEALQRGRLRCTKARGHGFVRVHPRNPYAFAYADDTPFFSMGDTCYGLASDSPITPELRTQYLKTRRAQHFNFVRLHAMPSDKRWQTDPTFWPFGGTPQQPDFDRFNVAYFRRLDAVLKEMAALGMNAELIVLDFYQPPMTDTRVWTPERESRWLRYLLARYAAFNNVLLWTIANEYETHPDGAYRLDLPGDPEWAKATARFIKQHDAFGHLVTAHPVISSSARGARPGDPFDKPWRIGGFFGEGDVFDVLSHQTGQAGSWDETQQCQTGDDPDLVASVRLDRRFNKPVLNSENGYEYLRGYPTYRRQVHHTDKVRRSAWRIVCAGGYFAAGFAGTLGMSDSWNRQWWGNPAGTDRYAFVLRDEGAPAQLSALYAFFTALPYWRMHPFESVSGEAVVALAEPGKVYVVYLPIGGKVAVDLSAAKDPLTARWFDPRQGKFLETLRVLGTGKVEFTAPGLGDWVLHLQASQ
jgi:hypothetical protein